ncbi:DNA topoisomerase III [Virgibacillus alimentarius]|uniref:DNA topoisomerase 3 n=1 Tax=Virgibacillus alimentarius TaxID=698769 RepID=A0ABS4S8Q1_9BACI|nr:MULTISPECIES: DNA topoisomerase III [Virgibacillus]MBP2257865.1 DNA topoisomerase-3 [Virgibacillus alimentarius]HLR68295.1 DNA topoisomerase III [Virgibacillus sp.]
MSKTVVLAEKPSVGRDIARVLHCNKKGNGYMEGPKYVVTWALGHLVTLADPEVYDNKYKTWNLHDLPMLPSKLKLVVMKKTGKQFSIVKSQLNRKDVQNIVIATDAGREGELVARWILKKAHVSKPIKRLWISSVTDKAIRDGFKQLKPGKKYEHLYDSAVARSEADWYVGLNATRALTTKFNAQLSSGRVQTPTLAMIAAREEEINKFQPRKFYGIEAKTNQGITFTWQDVKNNKRIFSKDKADELLNRIKGKTAKVTHIKKEYKKKFAPQLYDLTELQRDANRIFGYSGKQTLSLMQKLYEQHKVLTYPRTDSRVISTDIVSTLKDRVQACGVDQYATAAKKIQRSELKLSKAVVNNANVSDHHAIIPTEQPVILQELNDKERKIYDLVVKRFLAVLLPPYEYEQTTITADIAGETFTAKGKIVKKQGWKEIYDSRFEEDEAKEEQHLPAIDKGQKFSSVRLSLTNGETQPPSRFTEGTLLQAMENPVRYMEKEEQHLAKTINKTGGLGTVATRADIIEKLFHNAYMETRGKHIFITSKGKQLLDLVPSDLRSPALTAEWEQKLQLIAEGKLKKDRFVAEMKEYAKDVVQEIKGSESKFKHDNMTGTKCPACDKLMLEIKNKKGRMLVCQDRSCGHRKNIAKVTNARCPNCHKRLELRGEGEGKMFICKCGHREKLSTFNERKQREKKHKVSRKDVNKYLKKQDDDFKNNALAEALAKYKK